MDSNSLTGILFKYPAEVSKTTDLSLAIRSISSRPPPKLRISVFLGDENLSFIYDLKNNFKISDKKFFSILNKFKGLPHRQEIFLKKNNVFFINDSKATTFEATKACLMNYKNILWILVQGKIAFHIQT